MKFQQVMAFFLTGATALSMSTTALAADLSDNADTTVSNTQTADAQEDDLTAGDKALTDAPASRSAAADAIYSSVNRIDPELTAAFAGMAVKETPDYDQIPEAQRAGMAFCFEAGIMTGDSQHHLRPNDAITRQEFAAVLRRCVGVLEKAGKITIPTDTDENTAFTDASAIAGWAKDAAAFCQTAKLMSGDSQGAFNPKEPMKTAELAQVLDNLSKVIK